jgi:hypothetical protein
MVGVHDTTPLPGIPDAPGSWPAGQGDGFTPAQLPPAASPAASPAVSPAASSAVSPAARAPSPASIPAQLQATAPLQTDAILVAELARMREENAQLQAELNAARAQADEQRRARVHSEALLAGLHLYRHDLVRSGIGPEAHAGGGSGYGAKEDALVAASWSEGAIGHWHRATPQEAAFATYLGTGAGAQLRPISPPQTAAGWGRGSPARDLRVMEPEYAGRATWQEVHAESARQALPASTAGTASQARALATAAGAASARAASAASAARASIATVAAAVAPSPARAPAVSGFRPDATVSTTAALASLHVPLTPYKPWTGGAGAGALAPGSALVSKPLYGNGWQPAAAVPATAPITAATRFGYVPAPLPGDDGEADAAAAARFGAVAIGRVQESAAGVVHRLRERRRRGSQGSAFSVPASGDGRGGEDGWPAGGGGAGAGAGAGAAADFTGIDSPAATSPWRTRGSPGWRSARRPSSARVLPSSEWPPVPPSSNAAAMAALLSGPPPGPNPPGVSQRAAGRYLRPSPAAGVGASPPARSRSPVSSRELRSTDWGELGHSVDATLRRLEGAEARVRQQRSAHSYGV